jgi:ABC-2 type transport system permease protein
MNAALRTEYRKLVTTRLWWILLLSMAAYMAFLAGVMAFALTQDPASMGGGVTGSDPATPITSMTPEGVARTIYTLATSLGYVFPVIVGAMAMTSEFRHQTITPTLLAEPRRTVFLTAKMLSSVVVGLLFGVVGTAATVGAGAGVLALMGKPTYLTDPIVMRSAALSVLALTVWTIVGVGFGALLTNQIAVIVIMLAFTQFVEPVLRIVLGLFDWSEGISKYLPGAAGEAITGSSFYVDSGMASGLLSSWLGFAVLLGYAIAFALVGRVTTLRHDIT